jgi:hypothetical protein
LGALKRQEESRATRARSFATVFLAAACLAGLSVRLPSLVRSVEIGPASVSVSPAASTADEDGAMCGGYEACGAPAMSVLASADFPACIAQPVSLVSPLPRLDRGESLGFDRLACESEDICSIARP